MGLRDHHCLLFIMGLLLSGSLSKEASDSRNYIAASATTLATFIEVAAAKNREEKSPMQMRMLIPRTELEPLEAMSQMDVVTPIATVPIINPSTPTATTTPTYIPVPTSTPTSPMTTPSTPTNPYTSPGVGTNPYTAPGIGTNPYTAPGTGTPSSSSGQSWCIASQTASQTALQVALDYACGYGGADCSAIQPGGSCNNPDTVRDHASYAFNSYYQKIPAPTSCDFGGTAIITNVDPSTSTCQYPSTSMDSSVLNTTNPTGSTIYGPVPPDSTSTAPILKTVPPFTLILLIISMGP